MSGVYIRGMTDNVVLLAVVCGLIFLIGFIVGVVLDLNGERIRSGFQPTAERYDRNKLLAYETHVITTLGATYEIRNDEIEQYPDYMDFVRNEIAHQLSKEVLEYAEIKTDKDVMREMTVVRALIRVVARRDK